MKNLLKLFLFLTLPCILQSQIYFEPLGGPPGEKSYSSFKDQNGILYSKIGIYHSYQKSIDNGNTWEELTNGDSLLLFDLIVDNIGNLFGKWGWTIYKSSDTGENWTPIFSHEESFDWNMSISPNNELFINDGIELYKTDDLGNTWEFLDSVFITKPLQWHPNGEIYSANSYDLYKSTDGGHEWEIIPDLIPYLYSIDKPIHISIQGNVFVRVSIPFDWTDYLISVDNAQSFDFMEIIESGLFEELTTNSLGHIIFYNFNELKYSSDNGHSWLDISSGIPASSNIRHVFVDVNDYLYVSCNNDVIYKSTIPSTEIVSSTINSFNPPISKIFPNPFSNSFIVELNTESTSPIKFKLKNISGQLIMSEYFTGKSFEITRNDIESGIYFYQIIDEGKIITTGKLVAK